MYITDIEKLHQSIVDGGAEEQFSLQVTPLTPPPPRLTSIVRGKMGGQMESNGVYSTGGGTRRASAHTPQTRSCFIGVGVCF